MSPQIATYIGILVLDNNANRAYLQQNNDQGQPFLTLMMLDSQATGVFDWQEVTAAWRLYSAPGLGLQSGVSSITFQGFWAYPPDSTAPVLHVVS